MPVSVNAVPAAIPEIALVIAGLKANAILPGLLQPALTAETKEVIRDEIDTTIGGDSDESEAKKAAVIGNSKSKVGLKDDPLLGSHFLGLLPLFLFQVIQKTS